MYQRFAEAERQHWWFQGRRRVVGSVLRDYLPDTTGRRLLDVGSGTGEMVDLLREFGSVTAMDSSAEAMRYCANRMGDSVRVIVGDVPGDLPAGRQFDVVTAFDVIEHLDDDVAALRALGATLLPGGLLILTVPAFPLLWSGHDVLSQHRRRYRRNSLRSALSDAGFSLRRMTHFNTTLFPLALVARLGERAYTFGRDREPRSPHLDAPPVPINSALRWILGMERHLVHHANLPFGVSLLAVAQQSAQSPVMERKEHQ